MKASYLYMMWHAIQSINYSFHQVLMERPFLRCKGKACEAVCFLTELPVRSSLAGVSACVIWVGEVGGQEKS